MRRSAVVTLAVLLTVPPGLEAGDGRVQVDVRTNGAAAPGVAVVLEIANQGKVNLGTTDAEGETSFALDIANLGKVPVQVVAEDCPDQDTVYLVAPDGQLPPEQDRCRRRVAGIFWWGKDRHLVVDVARGTLETPGDGIGTGVQVGVGGALVAGGLALFGGDSGSPAAQTPPSGNTGQTGNTGNTGNTGPPPVMTVDGTYVVLLVTTSGLVHQNFTLYHTIQSLSLALNGGALTVSGPAPWVTLMGPFEAASGNFNVSGRGTVAGFPNRPITFTGNAANNRLTGTVMINELPPSPTSQTLSVTGQKPQ